MEKHVKNKLVRDKIPVIIKNEGRKLAYRTLNPGEVKKAVRDKIKEECEEVLEAVDKKHIVEEVADLLAVMKKYIKVIGKDWSDVETEFIRKQLDAGLYENNVYLQWFEKQEGDSK